MFNKITKEIFPSYKWNFEGYEYENEVLNFIGRYFKIYSFKNKEGHITSYEVTDLEFEESDTFYFYEDLKSFLRTQFEESEGII